LISNPCVLMKIQNYGFVNLFCLDSYLCYSRRKLFLCGRYLWIRMGSCFRILIWVFVLFMHSVKAYCWVLYYVDFDFLGDHWQNSCVSKFTYMIFFFRIIQYWWQDCYVFCRNRNVMHAEIYKILRFIVFVINDI
jgi:hypothetical protein